MSDNAAAEDLWNMLGTPAAAAKKVTNVLRAAGDRRTVVEQKHVRSGFTSFGQTLWSLEDQARFAAALPGLDDANFVLSLMGQITRTQRWGLGAIPNTAFKGGWGPNSQGFLVRQLGVILRHGDSPRGVAIAVQSRDGFEAGTADLSTVAAWLLDRLDDLP